jgi:archaellum component FlaC
VADKDPNVDSRLSRLETIIDAISDAVNKIEEKLDGQSKINWAPIAIGVTVFFTVAGSVSTIYNARISTINAVVGKLTDEVSSEKIMRLEKDVEDIDNRVEELEKH